MHQYQNPEMEMMDLEMLVKSIVVGLLALVMHAVEQIEKVVVEMDDLVLGLLLLVEYLLKESVMGVVMNWH